MSKVLEFLKFGSNSAVRYMTGIEELCFILIKDQCY